MASPLFGAWWDPTTWVSDIVNGLSWAAQQGENALNTATGYMTGLVESAVLWIYSQALAAIVGLTATITNSFAAALDWMILTLAGVAASLGPFALPMMLVFLTALAAAVMLIWDALKDTPVVGGFM